MSEEPENGVNLLRLHAEVVAEIELAEGSSEPAGEDELDLEVYEVRLRTLRDAVETAALYLDPEEP